MEKTDVYKQMDNLFLSHYKNGLNDEKWLADGKKHKVYLKIIDMVNTNLSQLAFTTALKTEDYEDILKHCTSVITKSTMVSVFEKVAFKNFIADASIHVNFLQQLYNVLYVDFEKYFNSFVAVLSSSNAKNSNAAKWTIVTCFLAHFNPNLHVFVKPTTVQRLSMFLKENIYYSPKVNLKTYQAIVSMVLNYKLNSTIAKSSDLIITVAIMYCALMAD